MKALSAARLALVLLVLSLPVEAAVPPFEYIQSVFTSADDVLDDARSAPAGARDRVSGELSQLESALTRYPDSAHLHLMMGRARIVHDCALGGDNCSIRAKSHLTKAVQLDPNLTRAHVLLAHDALNSGCRPCANPHIVKAQSLGPGDPYVLEIRARYAEIAGMEAQAEKLYLQAIDAFPTPKKRWQAYNWLSNIYHRREDYKQAEWALQKALEAAPDGAWSNGNLGTFYIFALGNYEKAIPALRKTLSIMNYGMARQGLALALYERWADAHLTKSAPATVAAYWKEAETESSDIQTIFLISASYSGTGRASRALLATRKLPKTVLEQVWQQGRTPLLMASFNDNTELAVFLIQQGANTNAHDQFGFFSAHAAGGYANYRILEALAQKNANLRVLTPETRETVLMQVAKANKTRPDKLKAAALLIDRGVPIEARSARGSSALTYAIGARDVEMMKYLLSRGANPDGLPTDGKMSPAAYAVMVGDAEILQELIKRNMNLDVMVDGMSLPDFAQKNGRPDVAKMLRSRM